MSGIRDRNVIDIALIEDGKYVLVILDDLEWNFGFRQEHGRILQNKINDYLDYIASGQAAKDKPGLRVLIRILAGMPTALIASVFWREFVQRFSRRAIYAISNGLIHRKTGLSRMVSVMIMFSMKGKSIRV